MAVWRRVKNSLFVLVFVMFILYIGYYTEEFYSRIQANRKLKRLVEYEKEIDELTDMLGEYKKEASGVQNSLKLLREAFDQVVVNQKAKSSSAR